MLGKRMEPRRNAQIKKMRKMTFTDLVSSFRFQVSSFRIQVSSFKYLKHETSSHAPRFAIRYMTSIPNMMNKINSTNIIKEAVTVLRAVRHKL